MSWQNSVNAAIRELKKEEKGLLRELDSVRQKIEELDSAARAGGKVRAGAKRAPNKNRLSPAGRAAISKAAKKRWAKYRQDQKRR